MGLAGICEFENLAADTMGEGYALLFTLAYPTTASVSDAISANFDVSGRSLSVRFTGLEVLNPESTPFTAEVSVWDEAMDEEAGTDVAPTAATCTIALAPGVTGATLGGTTEVPIVDGKASFSDLEVTGSVVGGSLMVTCTNSDDFNSAGTSGDFNVYPSPKTGNLKTDDSKFTYIGNVQDVQNVLDAFASILVEDSVPSSRCGCKK